MLTVYHTPEAIGIISARAQICNTACNFIDGAKPPLRAAER